MRALLLPGMDGTGDLFAAFARALAPLPSTVLRYPPDVALTYAQLLERALDDVSAQLPAQGSTAQLVLVGESFSGPLAVRLCQRLGTRVRALVLVASFVRTPAPLLPGWVASLLPAFAFAHVPPAIAVRSALLGDDASDDDVCALQSALAAVRPFVLAQRLREIHRVEVSSALAALTVPMLYLAGGRDRLLGLASAAHVRRVNPRVQLKVLDAPHLVLQRRPLEAADAVRAWLAQQPARQPA